MAVEPIQDLGLRAAAHVLLVPFPPVVRVLVLNVFLVLGQAVDHLAAQIVLLVRGLLLLEPSPLLLVCRVLQVHGPIPVLQLVPTVLLVLGLAHLMQFHLPPV